MISIRFASKHPPCRKPLRTFASTVVRSLVLGFCLAPPAHADYSPYQGLVEMPQVMAPMVTGVLATENLRLLMEDQARGATGDKTRPAASPSGLVAPPRGGASRTAHELALRYPPDQRPQIEQAFSESLVAYKKLEAKFGVTSDDVAGAVAAYIAGNYMAYRDVDFPDSNFKPLVAQMRAVLARNTGFLRASGEDKRALYEQLAITGTFMAVTRETIRRQGADPQVADNFRKAAQANLEQFLKIDANRISITAQGLVIL